MATVDVGTQSERSSDYQNQDQGAKVECLTNPNQQLLAELKLLSEKHERLKILHDELKKDHESVKVENNRLETQICNMRQDLDHLRQAKTETTPPAVTPPANKPSYGELKLELIQTRQELTTAKEYLQSLKNDRKRLKSEKLELLAQIKQLYADLQDKEAEFCDFIRNYKQHARDNNEVIKQLEKEKECVENEKWNIITKAKEATERAVQLKTQLENKDIAVRELQGELVQAKGGLVENQDEPVTPTQETPCAIIVDDDTIITEDGFSTMEESSVLNRSFSHPPTSGPEDLPPMTAENFKWFTQSSDLEVPTLDPKASRKKKGGLGSFKRAFSKGKLKRSMSAGPSSDKIGELPRSKLCVLSEENLTQKLNTIEHMVGVTMADWRAHQVLAWLEISLAMPMYSQACLTNVKSGRVLLGLSDSELSSALGVTNTMHRRKLRLAIEQHRNPDQIKYPSANEMDPAWVCHRLLSELGLPQYSAEFEAQLCDGPILNTLTRRDLEKHFHIHRKFHQTSLLHAIELMRMTDFNKEKLNQRRNACEERDTDLIVWTNQRVIKWLRTIDLDEYTEKLSESGLHGAIMVLEPTFTPDTLASMLGIPPSKSYIRRHLTTELESVLRPARAALDPEPQDKSLDIISSKFTRGRKGSQDESGRSRLSFKGSLGRAFGKKIKDELKHNIDADNRKVSSPIPFQHQSLSSLNFDSELIKKGFCFQDSEKKIFGLPDSMIEYLKANASPMSEKSCASSTASNTASPEILRGNVSQSSYHSNLDNLSPLVERRNKGNLSPLVKQRNLSMSPSQRRPDGNSGNLSPLICKGTLENMSPLLSRRNTGNMAAPLTRGNNSPELKETPESPIMLRSDPTKPELNQTKSAKRKAIAYSDQTLYKSDLSDLTSSNRLVSGEQGKLTIRSDDEINVCLSRKLVEDSTPSQETLTDCSDDVENKKREELTNQNDAVSEPIPDKNDIQLASTMNTCSTVSTKKACKKRDIMPSVTFDRQGSASDSQVPPSKPPLQRTVSVDATIKAAEERMNNNLNLLRKRASLKEVFPQTTSV